MLRGRVHSSPEAVLVWYLVDDLHLDLFLISDGFLFADFLCFHAHHLYQLVRIFIFLLEFSLLNCQLGF